MSEDEQKQRDLILAAADAWQSLGRRSAKSSRTTRRGRIGTEGSKRDN